MTQSADFSKLSTTLNYFNNALKKSDKLNDKALQTIQHYLNDPEVTTLDQEDGKKMQRPLKQLELLRDQSILVRASSKVMKQINRQLIRVAELITKNSEETKKNAYFIIVKLEVCFLKILSEEALDSSKRWEKIHEEKMIVSQASGSSRSKPHPHALYMERQQRLINELMNAALFDVTQYFHNKNELFTDHFTLDFLDSLNTIIENPGLPVQDKMSNDVLEILRETAKTCDIPIAVLIPHLQYAIIGLDERTNQFTIPLQTYIRNTESPTLIEFNKTINFSQALSSEEVDQFSSLFKLYCELLLPRQQGMPQIPSSDVSNESFSTLPEVPVLSSSIPETLQSTKETTSITNEFAKLDIAPESTDNSLLQASGQGSNPGSLGGTVLTSVNVGSASAGRRTQKELPPPQMESDSNLKFIWIEPNREDYYRDYLTIINPGSSTHFKTAVLLAQIPDDWIRSRIFLCVSATQARDLLLHLRHVAGLYRVYVLCQNKAEEDKFWIENNDLDKIRIATSDRQAFIRQLAIDIVPSFIEIGDIIFETNDYKDASRWYKAALERVNVYGDSMKNLLFPTINKKLAKCSRV